MHDAAANIARIDPAQCRLAPTRLPIFPDDCTQLIASIRAHGQLVPGLVRRTPPGDPVRYEIVCGARRHYAIAALRDQNPAATQPFFAAIRPLSDEQAFAAADRDNRHRADISDLQRAFDYTFALQKYYAGNQAHMARAIQIHPTNLGRYLSLAALPEELYTAFGRPDRLTLIHARTLLPHLKNPETNQRILQTAADLSAHQKHRFEKSGTWLPPETILRRLLASETPAHPTHTVTTHDGRNLATGLRRPNGTIQITITRPHNRADALAATAEILDNLCETGKGCHVATLSETTTTHALAA
jgi:ParB family chromosome partitioning protein